MLQTSSRTFVAMLLGLLVFSNQSHAAEIKTGNAAFDRKANDVVKAGAEHIRGVITAGEGGAGKVSLGCYALLKAGEPSDSPIVKKIVADVLKKFPGTNQYSAKSHEKEIYEAGVDAMLLEAVDADRYRAELTTLVNFISRKQLSNGGWDYPKGLKGEYVGDTSMTQYAMLGLWAAQRANIPIDLAVVDKCAGWHIRSQRNDGGFSYHPGISVGPGTGSGNSTGNMSAGGASSLGICRVLLYPKEEGADRKSGSGVLESVRKKKSEVKRTYNATVSKAAIEKSMNSSYKWVINRLLPSTRQVHGNYYYYTMERAAALNAKKGDLGWYTTLGNKLFELQLDNGSFKSFNGDLAGTAFVILFFLRPTAKLIDYKGGILKADRGLPSDLSQAFNPDAEEAEKKT